MLYVNFITCPWTFFYIICPTHQEILLTQLSKYFTKFHILLLTLFQACLSKSLSSCWIIEKISSFICVPLKFLPNKKKIQNDHFKIWLVNQAVPIWQALQQLPVIPTEMSASSQWAWRSVTLKRFPNFGYKLDLTEILNKYWCRYPIRDILVRDIA